MKVHELTPIERTMTIEQLLRKFVADAAKEGTQGSIEFPKEISIDVSNEPK
jgi:hypothetical protein